MKAAGEFINVVMSGITIHYTSIPESNVCGRVLNIYPTDRSFDQIGIPLCNILKFECIRFFEFKELKEEL